VRQLLDTHRDALDRGVLLGGPSAVSVRVHWQLAKRVR
jgi:hypothetical protein